jgi:hypothetical protein
MTEQTYTLAWILPYVRQALKGKSSFEFRTYANALFIQFEKAESKASSDSHRGLIREGRPFDVPFRGYKGAAK